MSSDEVDVGGENAVVVSAVCLRCRDVISGFAGSGGVGCGCRWWR